MTLRQPDCSEPDSIGWAAWTAVARGRGAAFDTVHLQLGSKIACGRNPAGDLTDASRAEPGQLGLDPVSGAEPERFEGLDGESGLHLPATLRAARRGATRL